MSHIHVNNVAYWIRRHDELKGDIRAVGNRGKSLQENEAAYRLKIRTLVSVISQELGNPEGKRVLDLGCGTGLYAPALTRLGLRYTGVDVSPAALAQAKARCPEGEFIQSDLSDFCSFGQPFDAVMAVDVLCHLTDDVAWSKAIGLLADLVEHNAVAIIIDHIEDKPRFYQDYVRHRTMDEYRKAVSASGKHLECVDARCYLMRATLPSKGGGYVALCRTRSDLASR